MKYKRTFFQQSTFFHSAPELRDKITIPHFTLRETKKIISQLSIMNDGCKANGLIEYVVFKATEHKKNEKKYASVLGQLRQHGWTKGACCVTVMLHSAVISDLPCVTKELLLHDTEWVHDKDFHGCVPMDYAQSPRVIKMLKDAGSRDARPYTGKDKWYRIPGHGWKEATPLRKAVYDGDVKEFTKIMSQLTKDEENDLIVKDEPAILKAIADLRFWRTEDKQYLIIKGAVTLFYNYHCCEKH